MICARCLRVRRRYLTKKLHLVLKQVRNSGEELQNFYVLSLVDNSKLNVES